MTGDNYRVWKERIEALLFGKGIWHLADPIVDEIEIDHRQKSEQALTLIFLDLREEQMVRIEECQTAREG